MNAFDTELDAIIARFAGRDPDGAIDALFAFSPPPPPPATGSSCCSARCSTRGSSFTGFSRAPGMRFVRIISAVRTFDKLRVHLDRVERLAPTEARRWFSSPR